jgi:DoxX-like family
MRYWELPMTVVHIIGWIIIAFFAVTGIINCAGSKNIRAGFARWGYPPFMHIVTGGLELFSALLMIFPATRWFGLALGFGVIIAALATVLYRREYGHTVPPALTLVVMTAWAIFLQNQ